MREGLAVGQEFCHKRFMLNPYPLMRPLIFLLDPETAHTLTVKALACSCLVPRLAGADDPVLRSKVFGLEFVNPVGLAAGFDKNAEALAGTLKLGFGFVEPGTVTPQAQAGNPKPRVFRLPAHKAVINRYGFNNLGLDAFLANVRAFRARAGRPQGLIGVNIGKNKDAPGGSQDFVTCARALAPYADYLVVNVSSPNTPGLRGLQNREELAALLRDVRAVRDAAPNNPPLLVKIAPDLTPEMRADIAEVVLASGIDGIIATNTTVARPDDLPEAMKAETGGLSGAPLAVMAQEVLRDFYRLTQGKIPLIAVGGIFSGADAYARIRAGASLVQVYTAMVYEGPLLAGQIKRDLAALLKRDGFVSVAEAVGVDAR